MIYLKMDKKYWRRLTHTISQNNCILMLGPDVSTETFENKDVPCTEILAQELAETIQSENNSWNIPLNYSGESSLILTPKFIPFLVHIKLIYLDKG